MQKKIFMVVAAIMTISSLILANGYEIASDSSGSYTSHTKRDEYNPHRYQGGNRTEADYNNKPAPYHNPNRNWTEEDYDRQDVEGD